MQHDDFDVIVIGGGIVGLACARAVIQDHPGVRLALLEKEAAVAQHQTGHNSGVVHSGIYYPPGSLKAELVRSGRGQLVAFCREHAIPVDFPGKVVVATRPEELDRLDTLAERGRAQGLAIRRLDADGLRAVEPHASGVAALLVPETGRTDFGRVADALATELVQSGAEVLLGRQVVAVQEGPHEVFVATSSGSLAAKQVVVCAGLGSGSLMAGPARDRELMIVPFRGEYYELVPSAAPLVSSMIYPVPDPRLPFLGVHLTKGIDGGVHAGPNAVPALAREGYRWRDIESRHLGALVGFPGTRRLARRYWRSGIEEIWRSVSKRAFVRAVQRLVPDITADMLRPAEAGVRAQALARDGALVDDFAFRRSARVVNVDNAPSPAATAAFAIGRHIASELRLTEA